MKIERTRPGSTPTSVGATRAEGEATRTDAAPAPRQVQDVTSIMGVPEAELTPKVRAAFMQLFEEVAKLREDLDRSKARLSDLERLADEDSLMPISNRRALVRELTRIIAYSQRYQLPSSVLYFDLNGMKAINDRYGHAAGDATLKHVAQALVESVRESDVVGRLGGDEFGVILVQADQKTAALKAQELAHAIESKPLAWEGEQLRLTVAYGAHTFRSGEDATAALNAADRAMYANKQVRNGPDQTS